MKRAASIVLSVLLVFGVFAIPAETYAAAAKAPGKVAVSSLKVTVVNGKDLKLQWGKAKTGKKVLKTTGYQVEYQVEVLQDNGKYKVTTKWKALKKGKNKTNHVYLAVKGNTYRVSMRVRAYNGNKYGAWTAASRAKAKKFVVKTPAYKPKYAAFAPHFEQIGPNRPVSVPDYLNEQGCVFDTYTGRDGYNFAMDSVNEGKDGVEVVHFTLDGDDIEQVGSVHFASAGEKPGVTTKLIGHANDGTIYMNEAGKKYLFVAISGGIEKSSTDSSGKSIKLAYIDLDELNRAEETGATVAIHGVTINTNGVKMSSTLAESKFSGITYTGLKDAAGRDIFVLKDGRTFYAAYLTFPNGQPALTFFDSARVTKPTFTLNGKTYDAATQGITYHNGFIYLIYSGEAQKALWCHFKVARITYKDLFSETYNDLRDLQVYENVITSAGGETLIKHIPEALFFTTLEGPDNIYLSVNRGTAAAVASDRDAIIKSTAQF